MIWYLQFASVSFTVHIHMQYVATFEDYNTCTYTHKGCRIASEITKEDR